MPQRVECATCGRPTINRKFCSRSCSAKTTNTTHPRRKRVDYGTIMCLTCGTTQPQNKARTRRFCNEFCSNEHRRTKAINAWLAGEDDGVREPGGTAQFIKRYLRETQGDKCKLCGWAERHPISGQVPVELDHVNGDWRDNHLENLRLLCPNCHSLTPTYRRMHDPGAGNGRWTQQRKQYVMNRIDAQLNGKPV